MANIPHGNSLLAQGTAIKLDPFAGNPFDPSAVSLAKNTAPFAVGGPLPPPGTLSAFPPYDLSDLTPAAINFRTPAGNSPATPLPTTILGVPMQDIIIDPTKLLTAALSGQTIESMTVITVATVASLQQEQEPPPPPAPPPPPTTVNFPGGGGSVANIPFLVTNADAATIYAQFWIEKIQGPTPDTGFLQLQYVQTVFLNFPVIKPGAPPFLCPGRTSRWQRCKRRLGVNNQEARDWMPARNPSRACFFCSRLMMGFRVVLSCSPGGATVGSPGCNPGDRRSVPFPQAPEGRSSLQTFLVSAFRTVASAELGGGFSPAGSFPGLHPGLLTVAPPGLQISPPRNPS